MENNAIITDVLLLPHGPLHYRISGKGKPVFLLHGFGEDCTVWNELLPYLPEGYSYILPDIPGSGLSAPVAAEHTALDVLADAFLALKTTLKLDSAVWIGHSMGGYICLAVAERQPQAMQALGLFHSSALPDNEEKKANRRKAINFIREQGSEAFLKTSTPGLFANKQLHLQAIENLICGGRNFQPETLVQYYEMMIRRPDRTSILNSWEKPVLWICGQEDQAVPYAHSLAQAYLADQSYFSVLRQSAHMGMLEETARSAAILGFFLHSV